MSKLKVYWIDENDLIPDEHLKQVWKAGCVPDETVKVVRVDELKKWLDNKSLYSSDLTSYQRAFANGRNHHIDELLAELDTSDSEQEFNVRSPAYQHGAPACPKNINFKPTLNKRFKEKEERAGK